MRLVRTYWWVIALVLAILIGWLSAVYDPPRTARSDPPVVTPHVRPVVMVNSISPYLWGLQQSARFRAGRMGNSGGRVLPHKVVVALKAYRATHPHADTSWYSARYVGRTTACMFNSPFLAATGCYIFAHSPSFWTLENELARVKIYCGGAGAIGMLYGGGWVGFGRGAAACLFTRYATDVLH